MFNDNTNYPTLTAIQDVAGECDPNGITVPGSGYGLSISALTSGGTGLPSDFYYSWKWALVYDGVQIAPLQDGTDTTGTSLVADDQWNNITVTVTASNANSAPQVFCRRVTAIRIYRASSATSSFGEHGLIKVIDIDDSDWSTSGNDKVLTFTEDGLAEGASFLNDAGYSEVNESTYCRYGLSAEIDAHLYIADCNFRLSGFSGTFSTFFPDSRYMVFKSMPYSYDTFDYTTNFIILNFVPIALESYNGRIWAFDTNKIVRINPNGMYIEDTVYGIGCSNNVSTVVTEYGMFWCDINGCYKMLGTELTTISEPIENSWQVDYEYPVVEFDGQRKQVLFLNTSSDSDCYAYHVELKAWSLFTLFVTNGASVYGMVADKDGKTYTGNGTNLIENFAGSTYRSMEWQSHVFTANDASQDKKWYKLILDSEDGTSTIAPYFTTDQGILSTALTNSDEIKTSGDWTKAKSIKFRVTITAGTGFVRSIGLLFRRLVGKR